MPDPTENLPHAQRLALAHAPRRARAASTALLALDARLATILRKRREIVLAQVRFAWWRELFEKPVADWPSGDPLLDEFAGWRARHGLAALVDGWEGLLADDLTAGGLNAFLEGRAAAFVTLGAHLGANDAERIGGAARVWAAADLAANLSSVAERRVVVEAGRSMGQPRRLPRVMRPLSVLGALGARALRRGGQPLVDGPASGWLALRTGLFGG